MALFPTAPDGDPTGWERAAFSADVKAELSPLFWLESVAVLALGVSWLVKGETLFGDRRPPRVEPERRGPTGVDARA